MRSLAGSYMPVEYEAIGGAPTVANWYHRGVPRFPSAPPRTQVSFRPVVQSVPPKTVMTSWAESIIADWPYLANGADPAGASWSQVGGATLPFRMPSAASRMATVLAMHSSTSLAAQCFGSLHVHCDSVPK